MQILHYLDPRGRDIYQDWLDQLHDIVSRIAVQRRIDRVADTSNLGNCNFCNSGVWELKIDVGPGYRVYYAESERAIVLLLCGGTKRTQKRDIQNAVKYWKDYQKRS